MADYIEVLGKAAADDICERVSGYYGDMEDHWSGMRARQQRIRWLIADEWERVFPDDVDTLTRQKVSNLFRTTTEDVGRLFAETVPTERVFEANQSADVAAEKRERILSSYTQGSREFGRARLEWRGMDMVAGAYTVIKVWPRFRDPASRRQPGFKRIDPLHVYPAVRWNPEEPTEHAMVHYTATLEELSREFPAQHQRLLERIANADQVDPRTVGYDLVKMTDRLRRPPELTILDFYSCYEIARVAHYEADGRSSDELLWYRENDTGVCPIQIAYRPSWSSEPVGQLDDARGIVQAKNQAWTLLLDYFIDMVYGGKLSWNVRNPKDKGPGTVYYAMGPDAKMDPVTPSQPSFAALQLLGQMETEARSTATAPASREGEVDLNKASAAFLTRAQGQLVSVVKSLQGNYADAKSYANLVAFEQDVRWCNAPRKKIVGFARGRRFSDVYTPSEDIGEDTSNVVRYGAASGLDLPTWMVLMQNRLATGSISRETFLENDPLIEDVPGELIRQRAEILEQTFLASLVELPPDIKADALVRIKAGEAIEEVAATIQTTMAARAAQNPLTQIAAGAGGPGAPPAPGAPTGAPGVETSQAPAIPPRSLVRMRR